MTAIERIAALLPTTLWSFRSAAWNGFIDFRGAPKYQTHWGWGTWLVRDDHLVLVNDDDGFQHVLSFSDDGQRFQGRRSDGMRFEGELLYNYTTGERPTSFRARGGPSAMTN